MSEHRYYYNGKELHSVGVITVSCDGVPVTNPVTGSLSGTIYTYTFEAEVINDGPGRTWEVLLAPPNTYTRPACQRGVGDE